MKTSQAPAAQTLVPDERQAFEAWDFFSKMNPAAQEYAWRGWQARSIHARKAEALLRRIEPHIDAIVCYASTMGEHEPNRIAADLRAMLAAAPSGPDHA